jgi:DNA-directed RNA polymerase specialized sigma subunit
MLDVAKEIAAEKGVSIDEAMKGMVLVQIEELLRHVQDVGGDRREDPRVETLQSNQVDVLAAVSRMKEHLSQVRPGLDAHESKIESLMDTVQGLVSALDEHAKEIVRLRQRVGITD